MHLIILVSVLMILWGSVSTFTAIANYFYPKVDTPTFQEFISEKSSDEDFQIRMELKDSETVYEEYVYETVKPYKEQALNELIKSIGWIAIPLLVFIYFQRQIHRRKTITS